MKERNKVIDRLNSLLTAEFTTINQYIIHAEMCQLWNKTNLYNIINKQKNDEIIHASWLTQRITLLGGKPNVPKLNSTKICQSVSEMIHHIKNKEVDDIHIYNESISFIRNTGDWITVELLNKILHEKKCYFDWVEMQYIQTEMVGFSNYISNQKDLPTYWF